MATSRTRSTGPARRLGLTAALLVALPAPALAQASLARVDETFGNAQVEARLRLDRTNWESALRDQTGNFTEPNLAEANLSDIQAALVGVALGDGGTRKSGRVTLSYNASSETLFWTTALDGLPTRTITTPVARDDFNAIYVAARGEFALVQTVNLPQPENTLNGLQAPPPVPAARLRNLFINGRPIGGLAEVRGGGLDGDDEPLPAFEVAVLTAPEITNDQNFVIEADVELDNKGSSSEQEIPKVFFKLVDFDSEDLASITAQFRIEVLDNAFQPGQPVRLRLTLLDGNGDPRTDINGEREIQFRLQLTSPTTITDSAGNPIDIPDFDFPITLSFLDGVADQTVPGAEAQLVALFQNVGTITVTGTDVETGLSQSFTVDLGQAISGGGCAIEPASPPASWIGTAALLAAILALRLRRAARPAAAPAPAIARAVRTGRA